jgi:hypothetical protein
VLFGVVGERFGAVPTLQQKRLAACYGSKLISQQVHFGRHRNWRDAFQHGTNIAHRVWIGPVRLLRSWQR